MSFFYPSIRLLLSIFVGQVGAGYYEDDPITEEGHSFLNSTAVHVRYPDHQFSCPTTMTELQNLIANADAQDFFIGNAFCIMFDARGDSDNNCRAPENAHVISTSCLTDNATLNEQDRTLRAHAGNSFWDLSLEIPRNYALIDPPWWWTTLGAAIRTGSHGSWQGNTFAESLIDVTIQQKGASTTQLVSPSDDDFFSLLFDSSYVILEATLNLTQNVEDLCSTKVTDTFEADFEHSKQSAISLLWFGSIATIWSLSVGIDPPSNLLLDTANSCPGDGIPPTGDIRGLSFIYPPHDWSALEHISSLTEMGMMFSMPLSTDVASFSRDFLSSSPFGSLLRRKDIGECSHFRMDLIFNNNGAGESTMQVLHDLGVSQVSFHMGKYVPSEIPQTVVPLQQWIQQPCSYMNYYTSRSFCQDNEEFAPYCESLISMIGCDGDIGSVDAAGEGYIVRIECPAACGMCGASS